MSLDKFYTPVETAKTCISLIPNISQYDLIIEPSAGCGNFSSQLNCIAYDLEPAAENIIQQDWLILNKLPTSFSHCLVIGNPPFGARSATAKAFIKQAQKLGAETIAFILPNTFSKLSNQSVSLFSNIWSLIVEQPLENSNFILPNGKNYFVPCSFYIWTKQPSSINLRQVKAPRTDDFVFCLRGSADADFSINGNSGKVKEISEITNPKAEHYIRAKNKTPQELKEIFSKLNFSFFSSVNGGNAWIGQQEILKAYDVYKKCL